MSEHIFNRFKGSNIECIQKSNAYVQEIAFTFDLLICFFLQFNIIFDIEHESSIQGWISVAST